MTEIVVGVDGSENARRALEWAIAEARLRHADVRMVTSWAFPALAALPIPAPSWREFEDAAEAAAKETLGRVDVGDVHVSQTLAQGRPAEALADAAASADLLVLGSRGLGGFKGLLLGSVSREVLHRATVPTVVVPAEPAPTAATPGRLVVVGVDGSASGRRAAEMALEEAGLRDGHVLAVHTYDLGIAASSPEPAVALDAFRSSGRRLLDEEAARIADRGVPVTTGLFFGSPSGALISAAQGADLLVVGSRGHGTLASAVLGSVSAACVAHAHCPVMVVPGAAS